ncbi:glutathione S-transferase family protein [Sneathiella sp.]|uniref:glutathione S-transferase family protein n=1 Tax=Sneathiella sp. TaxID=1964365 RepID=UPI002FDF2703
MLTIYGDAISGNCYKVKLIAVLTGRAFEWRPVNVVKGETRTEEFLALNPNGRVPIIVLDSGEVLAESNAILFYLAEGSPYLPEDPLARARVLQWMFFEQYSHEPYIAVARYIIRFLGRPAAMEARLAGTKEPGLAALRVMERQLSLTPFLTGETFTIADIALYGYTHLAGEGEFDLAPFPAIRAWFKRIEAVPGFIPMG